MFCKYIPPYSVCVPICSPIVYQCLTQLSLNQLSYKRVIAHQLLYTLIVHQLSHLAILYQRPYSSEWRIGKILVFHYERFHQGPWVRTQKMSYLPVSLGSPPTDGAIISHPIAMVGNCRMAIILELVCCKVVALFSQRLPDALLSPHLLSSILDLVTFISVPPA